MNLKCAERSEEAARRGHHGPVRGPRQVDLRPRGQPAGNMAFSIFLASWQQGVATLWKAGNMAFSILFGELATKFFFVVFVYLCQHCKKKLELITIVLVATL